MDSRVFDLSQGIHSLAIESSFKFGHLELNLYVSRLISRDIQAFGLRICGNGSGLERRILGLVWMRPNGGKGIGNECASR